jgi:photosystem II stability/assembly factor-like uncharacterized protein
MGTINIRRTFGANKVERGKYQTAVVDGGYIYRSTNYGVTWTQATSDTTRSWSSVAMSSDGKYQTAVANGGYIYRSTNYGVTWNTSMSDTSRNWNSVAINK